MAKTICSSVKTIRTFFMSGCLSIGTLKTFVRKICFLIVRKEMLCHIILYV